MKKQVVPILLMALVAPAISHAEFDPLSWLKSVKITTYAKPIISTSTPTTTPFIIDPIRERISQTLSSVFAEKEKTFANEIGRLKSENESLKRTITLLQQKLTIIDNAQVACNQNIEKIKFQTSPDTLEKVKNLEWKISGDINNNFRNKIDEFGQTSTEKVLNIKFFREGNTASTFQSSLKQYDDLMGTDLMEKAQKFIQPSGSEIDRFQDFYNYFQSIRKFPK